MLSPAVASMYGTSLLQLEATQSCDWHNTFVCGGSTLQILAAECLFLWKASILPQFLFENASVLFWCMYRASCTVYYPDQQMHTGNTNTRSVHPIQNNLTSPITLRWPCIIYINLLQDYTYKTAQTVYTATKLTTSMYCNHKQLLELTMFCRSYFIIRCKHFNLLIYWFCNLNYFCNFSIVEG